MNGNGNGWRKWLGYIMAGLILTGIIGVLAGNRITHLEVDNLKEEVTEHEKRFGHDVMDSRVSSIEGSRDLLISQLQVINDRLSRLEAGQGELKGRVNTLIDLYASQD